MGLVKITEIIRKVTRRSKGIAGTRFWPWIWVWPWIGDLDLAEDSEVGLNRVPAFLWSLSTERQSF